MGYIKKGLLGISWWGGFRILARSISFIRIAILARILAPAQFGVFGLAALTLSSLEIITETGINVFLIQEEKNSQYINTAWVISILRGAIISLTIYSTASFITIFFKTPEAIQILKLISVIPFIKGFTNPAIINYQKNLHFKKEVYLRSMLFLVSTIVTIALAIITTATTSLVWGLIAAAIMETLFSLLFIKPLPQFKLEQNKTKKIIKQGKWVTLTGIFNHFFMTGDDLVVSKFLGKNNLGIYQMAYKISILPITEIADAFGRVSFPIYSKIAKDRQRLKKAFTKTTLTISALVIPFSVALFVFAEQFILIILGPKWIEAIPILKILAIFGAIRSITGSSSSVLLALKKQREVSYITLVSFLALIISIFPLMNKFGIIGVGIATIIGSMTALPLIIYYLRKELFYEK